MNKTNIEWAQLSWNPITGCDPVSPGCKNCYAKRFANRFRGKFGYRKDDPFKITVHHDRFKDPAKIKKGKRIFVCSMGDLFHEDVQWPDIDSVLNVCFTNPQHTYMILTKRPEHAWYYFKSPVFGYNVSRKFFLRDNIWLGVTAENQEMADERISILCQIPAAVIFASCEPLLENINIEKYLGYYDKYDFENPAKRKLDWVICGAETGPGKRHMDIRWAERLLGQCIKTDTPFFFKKNSEGNRMILDKEVWSEFPKNYKGEDDE